MSTTPNPDTLLQELGDAQHAAAHLAHAARLHLQQTSVYAAAASARHVFPTATTIALSYWPPERGYPEGVFVFDAITDDTHTLLTDDTWSHTPAEPEALEVFDTAIGSLRITGDLPADWPLHDTDDGWLIDIVQALTLAAPSAAPPAAEPRPPAVAGHAPAFARPPVHARSTDVPLWIDWSAGGARWACVSEEQLDAVLAHLQAVLGTPDTIT